MHIVIFKSDDFETERKMQSIPTVGTNVVFDETKYSITSVTIILTYEYWETPKVIVEME